MISQHALLINYFESFICWLEASRLVKLTICCWYECATWCWLERRYLLRLLRKSLLIVVHVLGVIRVSHLLRIELLLIGYWRHSLSERGDIRLLHHSLIVRRSRHVWLLYIKLLVWHLSSYKTCWFKSHRLWQLLMKSSLRCLSWLKWKTFRFKFCTSSVKGKWSWLRNGLLLLCEGAV